jgi:hypothetical protein
MPTTRTLNVSRWPYTADCGLLSRSTEVIAMPNVISIVFVVDDDISVRESLELLVKSAGWQPETSRRRRSSSRARAPPFRAAWCSM